MKDISKVMLYNEYEVNIIIFWNKAQLINDLGGIQRDDDFTLPRQWIEIK